MARGFEDAAGFAVAEVRHGLEVERIEVSARGWSYRDRAKVLASMGVTVVLCDEISSSSTKMLTARGIEVQPGTAGTIDAVLRAFCRMRFPGDESSPATRSTEARAS